MAIIAIVECMRHWKTLLKIGVSGILVYWLIRHVDWRTVGDIAAHVSLPLILVYVGLQLVGNIISAAKWQYLARIQGFEFSVKDGTIAYLTGAFINNFLPSTVGGDAYRVFWMSQAGRRSRAFTAVLLDRITGLLALFLFTGFGLALLPWGVLSVQPAFIIFAAITLSIALAVLCAFFWTERFYRVAVLLTKLLPWQRPATLLGDFQSFAERRVYTGAILWSVLFTVIGIGGSNFFLFSSFGVELSPLAFGSVIFAATLVANIPISINNIGVKEWSYVFFFGLLGVSTELAITAALVSRILQMLISFIALPGYLAARKEARTGSHDQLLA